MVREFYQLPAAQLHTNTLLAGVNKSIVVQGKPGSKLLSIAFSLPTLCQLWVSKDDVSDYAYIDGQCGVIKFNCVPFELLTVAVYNSAAVSNYVYVGISVDRVS
jgi:hypothetical protein